MPLLCIPVSSYHVHDSLFPSKMTAFGFKTAGADAFNAIQPTGNIIRLSFPAISHRMPGRYGMPHDVAGLSIFLASRAGAHVTGTHTLLDGGSRYNAQRIVPAVKL